MKQLCTEQIFSKIPLALKTMNMDSFGFKIETNFNLTTLKTMEEVESSTPITLFQV